MSALHAPFIRHQVIWCCLLHVMSCCLRFSRNHSYVARLHAAFISISDRQLIQDQVLEILPMVSEASAISEELNKYQTFDVVLMTVAGQGTQAGNGTKYAV